LALRIGRLHAALGNGNQALDKGPKLLGLGHRRLDVLVHQQRRRLVAKERDAVLGDPAELPVCIAVTHGLSLYSLPSPAWRSQPRPARQRRSSRLLERSAVVARGPLSVAIGPRWADPDAS